MTTEEIQEARPEEDVTRDAWCIAMALRVMYVRTVSQSDSNQGADSVGILVDLEKTANFSLVFIGERLQGLEDIVKDAMVGILGSS